MRWHLLWRTWTSIRDARMNFRLYWYAVATLIGLLMLVLGINVSFSQLAGIYSAASTAKRATVVGTSSGASDNMAAQSVEPTGALAAPSPPNSSIFVHRQIETAAFHPDAPSDANGKKTQPMNAARARLSLNSEPRRAQPADSPGKTNGNRRNDTARTLKVVAASIMRDRPSDKAKIIGDLLPGSRVTVIAELRDYYHVRSLDKKAIHGYVHREDAFFERKK
jgi:hypothetical protein